MSQFDQWRDQATPERQTGRVCFDREAKAALLAALEEFASAKKAASGLLDDPDEVVELAEQVKQLDGKVADATKEMTFERIPRGDWKALEEAHPATDAQRKANPKQTLDPEGFEPAVAAATCVDPGLTLEDARWLRDFLPNAEWEQEVLGPIWVANQTGRAIPKGVSDIADRLISELRSISPAEPESR